MTSFVDWLERFDVSRPHRSGRWRVRRADIQAVNLLAAGGPLSVGGFFSMTPRRADIAHVGRWRESDEFRYKANAAGFLYSAKHRHRVDGSGHSQHQRARAMCRHIRSAMTAFAAGDKAAGETAMHAAWSEYMLLLTIANAPLIGAGVKAQAARREGGAERGRAARTARDDLIAALAPRFAAARDKLVSQGRKRAGYREIARVARQDAGPGDPLHDKLTEHYAERWLKSL